MENQKINQRQKDDFNKNYGVEFDDLNQKMFSLVGEHASESEHLSSKPYSY
jgi:hypothetical protein